MTLVLVVDNLCVLFVRVEVVGARAVLQSAGVLHTTTIDELESGAIAKLERLLNDRKSEAK